MEIKENPIIEQVIDILSKTKNNISIAVPFMSSYIEQIFRNENITLITNKRIILRVRDDNYLTFDLKSMEYLLNLGFEIRFDNFIHLKLYIFDEKVIVTSSNLTQGGFVGNKELSVFCDEHSELANNIFENIWNESIHNIVDKDFIKNNWSKYLLLKSKNNAKSTEAPDVISHVLNVGQLDLQALQNKIFYQENAFYNHTLSKISEANKQRTNFIDKIGRSFSVDLFYAPEHHINRYNCLFYDFVYGVESSLAGTGLRELQFKTVFTNNSFREVIEYIYPQLINLEPWNLTDENVYFELCKGIFQFKNIPQYSETMPIRLISYFYPDYFIQIFKLQHLKEITNELGLQCNTDDKGEQLFTYNAFIKDLMVNVPYPNYVKSMMLYAYYYTIKMYQALSNGITKNSYLNDPSNNKVWIKTYLTDGYNRLVKLKAI